MILAFLSSLFFSCKETNEEPEAGSNITGVSTVTPGKN